MFLSPPPQERVLARAAVHHHRHLTGAHVLQHVQGLQSHHLQQGGPWCAYSISFWCTYISFSCTHISFSCIWNISIRWDLMCVYFICFIIHMFDVSFTWCTYVSLFIYFIYMFKDFSPITYNKVGPDVPIFPHYN